MFERFRVGSVEGCIGFVSDEDSLFRRLGYLEFRNGYAAIAIASLSPTHNKVTLTTRVLLLETHLATYDISMHQ